MVNFNVNPDKTNNPPNIIKPETSINWDTMIYNLYSSSGAPITAYNNIYQPSTGKNITISRTTYDESLGYYVEDQTNYLNNFLHVFEESILGEPPVSLINIPYPNISTLWQYALWNSKPKTWLFNDIVSHLIVILGPIGMSYNDQTVTTTLNFSEDFVVLNNLDYLPVNTTNTNNSITSSGGYAILYFPQFLNKLTVSSSNSLQTDEIGSSIKFGLINDLSVFGLDTNVRESRQVTFNIDNNTYDNELITNPVPFEIPEFNYYDYDSRKLVKFNIFEKE